MDEVWIQGGRKLEGTVPVSGSKNATLPILTATLLAPGIYRFTNVPALKDVSTMLELLALFGVRSKREDGHALFVDSTHAHNAEAPYELVKTMRASIYVLGPLLARFGEARVSLPGGCAWGPRPVDLHIKGMRQLGAEVEIEHGYIVARCEKLTGAHIPFEISSVGATGNLLMAAATAEGETTIDNAAETVFCALPFGLSSEAATVRTRTPMMTVRENPVLISTTPTGCPPLMNGTVFSCRACRISFTPMNDSTTASPVGR